MSDEVTKEQIEAKIERFANQAVEQAHERYEEGDLEAVAFHSGELRALAKIAPPDHPARAQLDGWVEWVEDTLEELREDEDRAT